MEKSVIIVFLCVALASWISWLIYNYAVFNKHVSIEAKVSYYNNKVTRIRSCINDLINAIYTKFPNSTIEYDYTDDSDEINGEIKY